MEESEGNVFNILQVREKCGEPRTGWVALPGRDLPLQRSVPSWWVCGGAAGYKDRDRWDREDQWLPWPKNSSHSLCEGLHQPHGGDTGKRKIRRVEGGSGTSFPLLAVETRYKMVWQGMVNRHSLTFRDLHPTRNKNLHDLTSSTWVADEQTVLSWQDTSSNGLEDELANEPKTEFTWLKQNMCYFMLKWDFLS